MLSSLLETAPRTTGKRSLIGKLAGLEIHAQTNTTPEDEIVLQLPAIGALLRFTEHEWRTHDPSSLIQRLERPIRQVGDTIATLRSEAQQARHEA